MIGREASNCCLGAAVIDSALWPHNKTCKVEETRTCPVDHEQHIGLEFERLREHSLLMWIHFLELRV